VSAVQADTNKICDWRSEVLAAEAKKAGSASERTTDTQATVFYGQTGLQPLSQSINHAFLEWPK